jgi:hypothetical protein
MAGPLQRLDKLALLMLLIFIATIPKGSRQSLHTLLSVSSVSDPQSKKYSLAIAYVRNWSAQSQFFVERSKFA